MKAHNLAKIDQRDAQSLLAELRIHAENLAGQIFTKTGERATLPA